VIVDLVLATAIATALGWTVSTAVNAVLTDAWRTRRLLRRTRVSRIAELEDGKLACVVGRVERDAELLTALMSRRPCVAYELIDRSQTGRVNIERRAVPFVVADASGRVRVEASEAAMCHAPIAHGELFEERVLEPGATVRLVGNVHLDPATHDAVEHGFRATATRATLVGSAKYPLLVDVER
jgi:hypothetical protein